MSIFTTAMRERKAFAIAQYIRSSAFTPAQVEGFGVAQWDECARCAGQLAPSGETIALAIQVLQDMEEASK